MSVKRIVSLLLTVIMVASLLVGCGDASNKKSSSSEGASKELPDLVMWSNCTNVLSTEKGSVMYKHYKDITGVGITRPYVEWNGGTTYREQLYQKIAAGEMPDIFRPVDGMEVELIENDALLDLTDILPKKAPHLWEAVPKQIWDAVASLDPTGEGRIYGIPKLTNFAYEGGIVRQDWLDKLGLEMPTTQEEYVNMLRAFKTKDPNGNGKQDEIPTGGREEVKYLDHLFAMYGIAMQGGIPLWDIYEGELTYSAVTQNMKDALQWISELYAEGLIDPETLLNDKAAWDGKIASNRVGNYCHWAATSHSFYDKIRKGTGAESEWAYMPIISAPGYEGFYTEKQIGEIALVVKNTDDELKIEAVMKVLDAMANPEYYDALKYGPEGYFWEYDEDGMLVVKDTTGMEMEDVFLSPSILLYTKEQAIADNNRSIEGTTDKDFINAIKNSIKNVEAVTGKTIAGDGMPSSVYDGYSDISTRTLFVEYASKIIAGEYSIDAFDEFVERWYETGGKEVTQRAREWYKSVDK